MHEHAVCKDRLHLVVKKTLTILVVVLHCKSKCFNLDLQLKGVLLLLVSAQNLQSFNHVLKTVL